MCGFVGAVCPGDAEPMPEAGLLRMRDALEHRGPDDAGHYLAPGIALGSRRLAILDLSEHGHMPMSTMGGRYHIVYNFQQLREPLLAQGVKFRSNGDTEVLLELYAREGPAFLERTNGMFAMAI